MGLMTIDEVDVAHQDKGSPRASNHRFQINDAYGSRSHTDGCSKVGVIDDDFIVTN